LNKKGIIDLNPDIEGAHILNNKSIWMGLRIGSAMHIISDKEKERGNYEDVLLKQSRIWHHFFWQYEPISKVCCCRSGESWSPVFSALFWAPIFAGVTLFNRFEISSYAYLNFVLCSFF
jgi:hypothetical protein